MLLSTLTMKCNPIVMQEVFVSLPFVEPDWLMTNLLDICTFPPFKKNEFTIPLFGCACVPILNCACLPEPLSLYKDHINTHSLRPSSYWFVYTLILHYSQAVSFREWGGTVTKYG